MMSSVYMFLKVPDEFIQTSAEVATIRFIVKPGDVHIGSWFTPNSHELPKVGECQHPKIKITWGAIDSATIGKFTAVDKTVDVKFMAPDIQLNEPLAPLAASSIYSDMIIRPQVVLCVE